MKLEPEQLVPRHQEALQPKAAGSHAAQAEGRALRAVFIGEGSLLIRCAEAFMAAGHQVVAICSANAALLQWAQAHGLPAQNLAQAEPESASAGKIVRPTLAGLEFDYLLSIAHLRVLPAETLAHARRLCINFHDALLPDYPGLNAPAWALMSDTKSQKSGETSSEKIHGVTWHEMTPAVDAGRILQQKSFAVAADETALSLNAKCYEAGLESFGALLRDLEAGTPALRPQGLRKPGFASAFRHAWARPAALATLDFVQPAQDIAALVRALDFGPPPYVNPLALPKIWTGSRLLYCNFARVSGAQVSVEPGTVLAQFEATLHVATSDGVVILSGCAGLDGAAHGVVAGQLLPRLDDRRRAALDAALPAVGKGEAFWRRALLDVAPMTLPYPQRLDGPQALATTETQQAQGKLESLARAMHEALVHDSPAGQASHAIDARPAPYCFALGLPARGDASVAAFSSWLAALTGQSPQTVFYADPQLAAQAAGLEPWLSAWVPLTLRLELIHTAADALLRTQSQVARLHAAGPCTQDLLLRLGQTPAGLAAARHIGVCLMNDTRAKAPWPLDSAPRLLLTLDESDQLILQADSAFFSVQTAERMAAHLAHWLHGFDAALAAAPSMRLTSIGLLPDAEAAQQAALNATARPFEQNQRVHDAIAAQAQLQPDALALECGDERLSFATLEARAQALAQRLQSRGVLPGDLVGLCLGREPALVLGLLAIWKAGAAYLPLDPAYPAHRLDFMRKDSGTRLVLTTKAQARTLGLQAHEALCLDDAQPDPACASEASSKDPVAADASSSAERAAYVIYTSGSTGQPKGVIVTHRNVMNFFVGMDARIQHDPGARWLAVTSLSFDISVLELCWTLARGISVVLSGSAAQAQRRGPDFSLFYFGNDLPQTAEQSGEKTQPRYRLLFDGARFADRHGFAAVWTPERHFHVFGGQYPNPAITSAALAAITEHLQIRAGSCVLSLHHPIRAAEDWAVVDNLSGGRVGVSFAAGWQPNDFALAPAAFADRKAGMFKAIEQVRRLWRGEAVGFDGPNGQVMVQTRPRPVQAEIPLWITAAGNPETFEQAGAMGCNLLTHLLGQSVADLAQKIALYRAAWHRAGHAGQGQVSLMLHTFVGEDEDAVREAVKEPMKAYLRSSMDLIRQAAWTFPTFVQRAGSSGKTPLEIMESQALTAEDMDALLEHAFARYYNGSALFGSQARCLAMVEQLRDIGVDDLACLIDFGVDHELALAHLQDLKQLMTAAQAPVAAPPQACVASDVLALGITHLQCTPSMAAMLVADGRGRQALSRLQALLVGGEALPLALARQLRALVPGQLLNMYGPTETTVWSTVCEIKEIGDMVPLGEPIANTQLVVRNAAGMACPALVPGELLIGGAGVTRGYLGRPALTAERFIDDPLHPGQRVYRTGDLVRWQPDGRLEFLGRTDHQVKLRGHRIELGEIESQLLAQPGVAQAVVLARTDPNDLAAGPRLQAYVLARNGERVEAEALRQALAAELPAIMVPASVQVMAAFPLTPNGKVDRLALPDPRGAIVLTKEAVLAPALLPEGELEQTIAGLWREVLGLTQVGVNDNFFDLGGHSLLVVQVQRRLGELQGQEVSITDMFRFPTIRSLAQHLAGHQVSTAVNDGQSRAQARRQWRMRSAGSPASRSLT
jgi:natural product biosynthesis luciferase-like monooxygenase protein